MTAALLVGPGVVIGAFVMLYATTLLDRPTLAPTLDQPAPRVPVLDHITTAAAGELVRPPANPIHHSA
jgi:hypothetical protein